MILKISRGWIMFNDEAYWAEEKILSNSEFQNLDRQQ